MAAEEAELDSTSKLIPSGAHPFADVIATADGASCEEGTALPGAISRSAGGLAAPDLEATGEVTDDVFPFREPSPRTVSLPPLQRMLRAKGGVQHSPQPSPRQRPATSTGSPTQLQQPRLALSDSSDGARAGSAASTLTGLPDPTGAAQSAQPPPVQGGRSGCSSSIAGDHADPARSVNAAESRLNGSRSSSQGHRHVAPDSSATALGFGRPCDSAPAAGDDESFLHQSRGRFQGSEGQAPAADEGRGAAEAARELEAQLKRLQVSRLSGLSRSLLCAGFEATRPVPARFRSRACLQSLSLGACMPRTSVLGHGPHAMSCARMIQANFVPGPGCQADMQSCSSTGGTAGRGMSALSSCLAACRIDSTTYDCCGAIASGIPTPNAACCNIGVSPWVLRRIEVVRLAWIRTVFEPDRITCPPQAQAAADAAARQRAEDAARQAEAHRDQAARAAEDLAGRLEAAAAEASHTTARGHDELRDLHVRLCVCLSNRLKGRCISSGADGQLAALSLLSPRAEPWQRAVGRDHRKLRP